MTTPVNRIPLSIDYTSRDYYSLRQELISRVQARVPGWLGNDPSDFGVAIIEAFAYMGDILNYYIDRVANESYISTATQRDTLLNLASMYGYSPAGYLSAVTDIELTNKYGYTGNIGGSILTNGTAQIIVPTGHPFEVDDYMTVVGVTTTATILRNGQEKTYNTSVYNGTYKITAIGLTGVGQNTLSYKPEFTITGITSESPSGTITAASGNGTFVTYTTTTPPKVGSVVTTTGITPSAYNVTNVEVIVVEDNKFTVRSTATDVYTSGGSFTGSYVKVLTNSQVVAGQKIEIKDVVSSSGNQYNGIWSVSNSTLDDITLNVPANKCSINGVYGNGTIVTYSGDNDFVVGQKIAIADLSPSGYNAADATVNSVANVYGTVTYVNGNAGTVTYLVDKEFTAGQLVTTTGISPTGYNLTNAVIASATPITASITSIDYQTLAGNLLVTTSSNHGMIANSYVTISGNTVYNSDPLQDTLKILEVSSPTQFVIAGTDKGSSGLGGTATVHRFTVSNAATGTMIIGGYAKVAQFTVTNTLTTTVTDAIGTATALATGSWTSGGKITFADLPTIVVSGQARNIGTILVPAGTELVATVTAGEVTEQVTFTTVSDSQVPFKGTSTVSAIQGKDISLLEQNAIRLGKPNDIAGELIGTSTGETDQTFAIANKIVDRTTIRVFVDNGVLFEEWTQVNDLVDYDSQDNVFTTSVGAEGTIYVTFGDGLSGSIPLLDKEIKTVYISGGGTIGNVKPNTLTKFGEIPYKSVGTLPDGNSDLAAFIRQYITPNNLIAANGGTDAESDDSIRFNAPRSLRALNRAVSLNDFSDLSLSVSGVGKANAIAESGNSVTLYISPTESDNSTVLSPGISDSGTPTSAWMYLKDSVQNFLLDKTQIGTTVTILPPAYTKVFLSVSYTPLPQYSSSVVEKNISKYILEAFSYNYVTFEDTITPEEVEFKLRQVEGVANIKVTELYREDGSGRNSLVGLPNEIFIFSESSFLIEPSASEARLSASSTGLFAPLNSGGTSSGTATLSPTYNQDVYKYRLSLPNGTATLRVTPVAHDLTNAKIAVNNIEVTTANPYVDITTPVGNTIVKILVTAGNGITIGTYTITANRGA
jgi:hypothetical protein